MTGLTVGSMFTGIGGIDLGLERAGMTVVWQAEVDPFCCRVLARHWPEVPNLGDVTTIDWAEVPRVDLVVGGYPCQPFSLAGKQLGELDPRHLWPRMHDAVRVLRPRFALLENVAGHLALGFGRVLGDLAEIGYDAEWDCIPAAAVGAPHRRDRVYVVVYPQREQRRAQPLCFGRRSRAALARHDGADGDVAHAQSLGGPDEQGRHPGKLVGSLARAGGGIGRRGPAAGALVDRRSASVVAAPLADANRPGRPVVSGRSPHAEQAGLRATSGPGWWDVEPDVGRVAHGVPARLDRLRGLGNAVVPQVAEHVGRLIIEAAA
jgi:DNA (cytosine-5)-methyltransferase 1